jgi:smad nuclear-interacting protein 1
VTDIPVAHPSCSKQHAAIQFRQITEKNEYGETSSEVKYVEVLSVSLPFLAYIFARAPYWLASSADVDHGSRLHSTELTTRPFVIDLDSTNGTHVNDQEIPKSRYYELRNSDGKRSLHLRKTRLADTMQ